MQINNPVVGGTGNVGANADAVSLLQAGVNANTPGTVVAESASAQQLPTGGQSLQDTPECKAVCKSYGGQCPWDIATKRPNLWVGPLDPPNLGDTLPAGTKPDARDNPCYEGEPGKAQIGDYYLNTSTGRTWVGGGIGWELVCHKDRDMHLCDTLCARRSFCRPKN